MADEEGVTRFFYAQSRIDVELSDFGTRIELDFGELKKPEIRARWEESVYNAVDGRFEGKNKLENAPAIEVYKWFFLYAKRNQRYKDQKALDEYESQVNQFKPGI